MIGLRMFGFFRADPVSHWTKKLSSFENVLVSEYAERLWKSDIEFQLSLDSVIENLSDDLSFLEKHAGFIFATDSESENLTERTADFLRLIQTLKQPPSLTALSIHAVQSMHLNLSEDVLQSLLIAGVLGEIKNDVPYHNNMHYRKVLLQQIRLAAMHNEIFKGTSQVLKDVQTATLMIAACIHDLGHDGLGNTVKGVYQQARLELLSYELAEPYFMALGLEVKLLEQLKIMLLCTDVTPLGQPDNPVNQMKAAYQYHFRGEKESIPRLNLDTELSHLEKDKDLALMALLLHEADMATSAGVTYDVTKYETTLFKQEIFGEPAYPEDIINFLDKICKKTFLTEAGQRLFSANLARIYALAQEDVKGGNEAYADARYADFFLSNRIDVTKGLGHKTIN